MRNVMRERGIQKIQILPEERPSATPTTEQMNRVFRPCTRHQLFTEKRGARPDLSPPAPSHPEANPQPALDIPEPL